MKTKTILKIKMKHKTKTKNQAKKLQKLRPKKQEIEKPHERSVLEKAGIIDDE